MKNLLIIFFIISLTIDSVYGKIIKVDDYNSIHTILKNVDQDTLVLFDIHATLITPEKEYTIPRNLRNVFLKYLEKKYGKDESERIWSKILLARKITYKDKLIPQIFEELKQKKIPTMAFTKSITGKYNDINSAEKWKIKELKSLNLNFDITAPLKGEVRFPEITPIDGIPKSTVLVKDGVIFTAGADKGMVLKKVLKHYNYFPKNIIFIDDLFENIESIEKTIMKYNINYTGIFINIEEEYKPKEFSKSPKTPEGMDQIIQHAMEEEKECEILEKKFQKLCNF